MLSGGELQLLKPTKLLRGGAHITVVLDEPTSSLHESKVPQELGTTSAIRSKTLFRGVRLA